MSNNELVQVIALTYIEKSAVVRQRQQNCVVVSMKTEDNEIISIYVPVESADQWECGALWVPSDCKFVTHALVPLKDLGRFTMPQMHLCRVTVKRNGLARVVSTEGKLDFMAKVTDPDAKIPSTVLYVVDTTELLIRYGVPAPIEVYDPKSSGSQGGVGGSSTHW